MQAGTNSGPNASPARSHGPPLTHRDYLGQRIFLHVRVRYVFALLIALGALFAKGVVGIRELDVYGLCLLAAVVAMYNCVPWFLGGPVRGGEDDPRFRQRTVVLMHAAIALDLVALTVGVWLVGGARSPFIAFYLVHVSLSFLNLSRRSAVALTGLAFGLLALLVIGEWRGVIPDHLPAGAVGGADVMDGRFALTVLVVYALLFGLLAFLLSSLMSLLRRGELRIRMANEELARLSEVRRDFIHIATHNLQAPIGAVTMFLRNLKDGLGGEVSEKQVDWLTRSLARLTNMSEFMSNLRTLSSLETNMIEAAAESVDVAKILRELVDLNREVAEAKGQTLSLDVPRSLPAVMGFPRLLREAVVNYITNAMKYTPEGGAITVRARHERPSLLIEVEDDGVGISEEDQRRLFSEYYRVAAEGGGSPSVKGTGLGLSIVKRVVESHGGTVGVRSAPGEGSTFWIELPAAE